LGHSISATAEEFVKPNIPENVSLNQNLTEIQDIENIQAVKSVEPDPPDDPYPDKTPITVLTREFLVGQYNLTTVADTTLWIQDLLLATPVLVNYLKPFRYFRSNIKVKFQFTNSPMQFGLVGISFLPYMLPTDTYSVNAVQQSQSRQELLDVSSQQALILDLPFLNYHNYLDLTEGLTGQRQWRIILHTYHLDGITLGAPTNVSLDVYASFSEPQCAGYVEPDYTAEFQSHNARSQERAWNRRMNMYATAANGVNAVNSAYQVGSAAFCAATGFGCAAPKYPALPSSVPEIVEQVNGAPSNSTQTCNNPKSQDTKPEMQRLRMDLVGDISSPTVKDLSTVSRLGDNVEPVPCKQVNEFTTTDIVQIATLPVLISDRTFASTEDVMTIPCYPIVPGSRIEYISRMFKYFRGGTRIMLQFCTSQMVSARVLITLFPAGGSTSAVGNLPTWTLTIRGSRTFIITVPYLQKKPWTTLFDGSGYVTPNIKVKLLETIPQPFDKVVSLYCVAFGGADFDFRFAGLQSVVPNGPGTTPDAHFQGLIQDFDSPPDVRFQEAYNMPYQGGITDLQQILVRYSSRGQSSETVTNYQSYPLPVTSWSQLYKDLDNFDYVCNLYKFYFGELQTKTVFSAAPANGVIAGYIQNNFASFTYGDSLKAGNSMAITHQQVWPQLDVTFPYMAEVPFNCILTADMSPTYTIQYNAGTEISKFLISAAPNFKLYYLMPPPDWYYLPQPTIEKEEGLDAVFQSSTSNLSQTFTLAYVFTGDGSTDAQFVDLFDTLPTGHKFYNFYGVNATMSCKLTRLSGTTNQGFIIDLQANPPPDEPYGIGPTFVRAFSYLNMPMYWADVTNSGVYVDTNTVSASINRQDSVNGSTGYCTAVQISPAYTAVENGSTWLFLLTYVLSWPAPVNFENASTTNISSLPVDVQGVVPVDIFDYEVSIPVLIENEEPIPVDIAESDIPITIDGPVAVYAHTAQTVPLWVNQYGPPSGS
jgi:hypothetical protein